MINILNNNCKKKKGGFIFIFDKHPILVCIGGSSELQPCNQL